METVGVVVLVAIVMTVGAGYVWLLRAGRPRRAATVAQSDESAR